MFLVQISSLSDVPARGEQVHDARRNRAAAMRIFSNDGQDESDRIETVTKKCTNVICRRISILTLD